MPLDGQCWDKKICLAVAYILCQEATLHSITWPDEVGLNRFAVAVSD